MLSLTSCAPNFHFALKEAKLEYTHQLCSSFLHCRQILAKLAALAKVPVLSRYLGPNFSSDCESHCTENKGWCTMPIPANGYNNAQIAMSFTFQNHSIVKRGAAVEGFGNFDHRVFFNVSLN